MDDPHLRDGLNVHDGEVTHKAVADALDLPYLSANKTLKH
jgi:alanine dehydrogenase